MDFTSSAPVGAAIRGVSSMLRLDIAGSPSAWGFRSLSWRITGHFDAGATVGPPRTGRADLARPDIPGGAPKRNLTAGQSARSRPDQRWSVTVSIDRVMGSSRDRA